MANLKEFYASKIDAIKKENDELRFQISDLRTLLSEIENKSEMKALSYRILLGLIDLRLSKMQSNTWSIWNEIEFQEPEAEQEELTIDELEEVTEDDLAFK